jgi:hypothetical protein
MQPPITKVRYFALGLVPSLFFIHVLQGWLSPADTRQAKIQLQVQAAILGGCCVMLLLGASLGFSLSKRNLSPRQAFALALVISNCFAVAEAMGYTQGLTLEVLAGIALMTGLLSSWFVSDRIGHTPTRHRG